MESVRRVGLAIGRQLLKLRVILCPGNIASVGIPHDHLPLVARQRLDMNLAIRRFRRARTTKGEGAGIAGIVEDAQHSIMTQLTLHQFALMRTALDSAREWHLVETKGTDGGTGRTGPPKRPKQEVNRVLDLTIRV